MPVGMAYACIPMGTRSVAVSKYHIPVKGTKLGAGGFARCGARNIDRYHVVTVSAETWNNAKDDDKCQNCSAIIRRLKQSKE